MRKTINKTHNNSNIVQVFRYVRPNNTLGGMTALCKLNYTTNSIDVYPAFCAENENFNKKVGRDIAFARAITGDGFSVPLIDSLRIVDTISYACINNNVQWMNKKSEKELKNQLNQIYKKNKTKIDKFYGGRIYI